MNHINHIRKALLAALGAFLAALLGADASLIEALIASVVTGSGVWAVPNAAAPTNT